MIMDTNKSSKMDGGSMRKHNRRSRGKRLAESNFREGDENTCSPCNDITIQSASGGSLEECDNEAQWEDIYRGFEAKMEELQSETFMLSCDLKRHADYCMKLKRENKFLLDELKHRCEPDVISFLEAKNPDQSPESVDSESDCQSTGSKSEYNSSPDHSADALNFNPNIETSS